MENQIVLETIGWAGAALVLGAYALNSFGILKGQSLNYQLLNLVGSILIMVYTYIKAAYPNTILNLIWGLISLTAIAKLFFVKQSPPDIASKK